MVDLARWTTLVLFLVVVASGPARAADPPTICATAADTWRSMQKATASQVAAFRQQVPKVCDDLRGQTWSREGELVGQPKPVSPWRMRDVCTEARVGWASIREAPLSDVKAFRDATPPECEAQRYQADQRIEALSSKPDTPIVRGPGSVFRDCPTCPEMVVIPGGAFAMGSPAGEKGRRANEGPQRKVQVGTFAAGRFEVTFADWDACAADGGCFAKGVNDMRWGRGKRPVVNVSWKHAADYVAWLSNKTGKPYRLLTEPEWEYAARGGATTAFWWGETGGTGYAHCAACGSLWEPDRTTPVGSFPPNAFGLHDTSGNVWEWVGDCYADYMDLAASPTPQQKPACQRVIRGGSWFEGPFGIRAANRTRLIEGFRNYTIGFRIARDLP